MYCLIKQPSGLGDILFCQKIAHHFYTKGYKIIWPVLPIYKELQQYIPTFSFVNIEDDFPYKREYNTAPRAHISNIDRDCIIVATDGCTGSGGVLKAKYNLVNLPWEDWSTHCKFQRNYLKEDALFRDVLHLTDGEEYALTNTIIGTPPDNLSRITIKHSSPLREIPVIFHDGYNLLDWCKVIENATEFYLEGSALIYIIENLQTKASTLQLFSRDKHVNFKNLFKVPWEYKHDDIQVTPFK